MLFGLNETVSIPKAKRHRLFDQAVLSMFQGKQPMFNVVSISIRDQNRIHVRGGAQLFGIGGGPGRSALNPSGAVQQ